MQQIAAWIGNNSNYEWGEIRVYANEDHALAVEYHSGCSCNSWSDEFEPENLHFWYTAPGFYLEVENCLADGSAWFDNAQCAEIRMAARTLWDNR